MIKDFYWFVDLNFFFNLPISNGMSLILRWRTASIGDEGKISPENI